MGETINWKSPRGLWPLSQQTNRDFKCLIQKRQRIAAAAAAAVVTTDAGTDTLRCCRDGIQKMYYKRM